MDHPAVRGVVALHRQQPGREAPQVQRQPLGVDPAGRWDLDLPVIPRPLDGDVLPAELHLRALRHPGGDGGVRPGEGPRPAELSLRLPAGDHRKARAHRPEAVVPVPVGQGDGGEGRDGQPRREELPHVGGRIAAVDEKGPSLPRCDAQNGPVPRLYRVRVPDPLRQLMDRHNRTSLKFLPRQRTTAPRPCQVRLSAERVPPGDIEGPGRRVVPWTYGSEAQSRPGPFQGRGGG